MHDRYPLLEDRRLIYEILRRMINKLVTDLIDNTAARVKELKPSSIEDIRAQTLPVVSLTEDIYQRHVELKRFLNSNLYRHDKVVQMTDKARDMIRVLFDCYMSTPAEMRPEFSDRAAAAGDASGKARAVADFIAGMTDRPRPF